MLFALLIAAQAPLPVTDPILRSAETLSGQPLRLPQGAAEVAASAVTLPPGGAIPVHRHAWQRLVYVERGRIRLVNHDRGTERDFGPGDLLVESLDEWHEGRALGDEPVRLIVIDLVPPGAANMVRRDP